MARIDIILMWLWKMFPGKPSNWYQVEALQLTKELNKLYKETRLV